MASLAGVPFLPVIPANAGIHFDLAVAQAQSFHSACGRAGYFLAVTPGILPSAATRPASLFAPLLRRSAPKSNQKGLAPNAVFCRASWGATSSHPWSASRPAHPCAGAHRRAMRFNASRDSSGSPLRFSPSRGCSDSTSRQLLLRCSTSGIPAVACTASQARRSLAAPLRADPAKAAMLGTAYDALDLLSRASLHCVEKNPSLRCYLAAGAGRAMLWLWLLI